MNEMKMIKARAGFNPKIHIYWTDDRGPDPYPSCGTYTKYRARIVNESTPVTCDKCLAGNVTRR